MKIFKQRYKHKLVSVVIIAIASFIILLLVYFAVYRQESKYVTLDMMCDNGYISIAALDETTTPSKFYELFGQTYEQYAEALISAYETKKFQDVIFYFEGKEAVLIPHFKEEKLQSVTIDIVDNSKDVSEWKAYSDFVIQKLRKLCVTEYRSSDYQFYNAEILLEFGPVDPANYEQNVDGTTAWSSAIGEEGSRITEVIILFWDMDNN